MKRERSSDFFPGTLQEKVDPYLRPLYDALYDMIEWEKVEKLLERGIIEVAPIAFMRGRTLSDSFIIVDEAQNTTPEQMKMVLTRVGFNSKMVVTGDITQIDLPPGKQSGLIQVLTFFAASRASASFTSTRWTSSGTTLCSALSGRTSAGTIWSARRVSSPEAGWTMPKPEASGTSALLTSSMSPDGPIVFFAVRDAEFPSSDSRVCRANSVTE